MLSTNLITEKCFNVLFSETLHYLSSGGKTAELSLEFL